MVCLPTCLTGWLNSFWLSFSSVTVSVFIVVFTLVCIVVWDRVIGATVFVSRTILSIFRLFFLPFQQTAQISVMFWFFTVVARWFGSVSVCVCSIVAHSTYL